MTAVVPAKPSANTITSDTSTIALVRKLSLSSHFIMPRPYLGLPVGSARKTLAARTTNSLGSWMDNASATTRLTDT